MRGKISGESEDLGKREGTTGTMSLGQQCALPVPGTVQRPLWLECSAKERVAESVFGQSKELCHPGFVVALVASSQVQLVPVEARCTGVT